MLRTLALEGERLDLFGVLNDNTADGRDISWVWDADWELLAPSVRHMTCSGTRAAELALRLKYAGVEPERLSVVPALAEGLDAALARGYRTAVRAPHLHRAARAARPARPARAGRGALAMSASAASFSRLVVWHDVECGGYRADLPLWRELADAEAGPVLDVGAGTGRVALELARAGHSVTALDREPELLEALRARAAGLDVDTVVADAAGFALQRRFGLVIVPMQTIQLLPERGGFLAAARSHLDRGGLLAIAITAALETFGELDDALLPHPDVGAVAGWRFESQPTAVRALPAATRIERVRRSVRSRRRRHRGGRRDRARAPDRRAARGRGPRGRVRRRAGPPRRRDRGARRRRGGAAACLSGRCACARSIPT